MTNEADLFWDRAVRALQRPDRLGPATPAEAQADFDRAGELSLEQGLIDAITAGVLDRASRSQDPKPSDSAQARADRAARVSPNVPLPSDRQALQGASAKRRLVGDAAADLPAARWRPALHARFRRILVRSVTGLAASLVAALGLWMALTASPAGKAYGMDFFQRRLLTARSYHLKGWHYYQHRGTDGNVQLQKVPTEVYVGWPCQYYATGFGSYDGVLGTNYRAENGQRYIEVDHLRKTCRAGRNFPFTTELLVASFLEQLPRTLMLGDASRYRRIRQERIADVDADVYEARSPIGRGESTRSLVWLDPATGTPVRMAAYRQKAGQTECLILEHDLVEVDSPPPPELFSFAPPAGYTVVQKDRGPESARNGSGGVVNSVHHDFRFEFNIADRAVLLCWAWYDTSARPGFEPDPGNPPGQTQTLTLSSNTNDRKYRLVPLRDDPADGYHWRWSLLVPQDGMPIGHDQPRLTFRSDGGASDHVTSAWQRLSRDSLARFVLQAQQLTLPQDAPAAAALTLEQIEAKIREVTGSP